jgi:hypothetical protein
MSYNAGPRKIFSDTPPSTTLTKTYLKASLLSLHLRKDSNEIASQLLFSAFVQHGFDTRQ